MKVFSFDTDLNIDAGDDDYDRLIRLQIVAYPATETDHAVRAHGNQVLTEWLDIPGDEAPTRCTSTGGARPRTGEQSGLTQSGGASHSRRRIVAAES